MMVDNYTAPLPPVPIPSFTKSDRNDVLPDITNLDLTRTAEEFLGRLQKAFLNPTEESLKEAIFPNGFLRDHLFFTWDLRTLAGCKRISEYLTGVKKIPSVRVSTPNNVKRLPSLNSDDPLNPRITVFIAIESDEGVGEGIVKLYYDKDNIWKAFTIFTALDSLKSNPERLGFNRPHGKVLEDPKADNKLNWKERLASSAEFTDHSPTVVIIGAGQAGLTVAARLVQLNIPTLIIEKNPRVADSWRNRYHSLVLHDPVWSNHLPYLPFPPTWPMYTPKDKIADWLENYSKVMEIPAWTSSFVTDSSYTEKDKWTLHVNKNGEDRILTPKHVILATGHAGEPNIPEFEGTKDFKGRVMHSSKWNSDADMASMSGKKVLIVGACNTAHDLAQLLYTYGAKPTIVQRSSTYILSVKHGIPAFLGENYHEGGPDVAEGDLQAFGTPNAVAKYTHIPICERLKADDQDGAILKGLDKAGFQRDDGPDGAGLVMKYFSRGGGYYIDVGASGMIAEGKIGLKHGSIKRFTPNGILFEDGEEVAADEVILATGYQNMRTSAGLLFPCVKDKVKTVWGFDEEGELQTMYRDSGHDGFWFMGGNFSHCRWFSKLLALKILGKEKGLC